MTPIAKRYAVMFFALLLALLFFHTILFTDRTFFLRDIHRWFYPMKYFLAESFKAGEIPFWCSHYCCGSPFLNDIQSGVFYPISIVFLLFPFPLSLNIFIVVHFFLGFIFFYLFVTSLGISRKSALITAISYCYGSYIFATVNTLNNLTTGIWMPAILWAFTRASKRPSPRSYGLTVFLIATAILGGEPQLFILLAVVLFFHGVFVVPSLSNTEGKGVGNGIIIVLLGLGAILLAMVQLGPTYLAYQHSARLGGLSYEEASRFSLEFAMLKHLFLPFPFTENFSSATQTLRDFFPGEGNIPWLFTIYPGCIILPLALLGFVGFPKKRLIWPLIFLGSLVLALGHNTSIHYYFYKILPIFRFPEKFMFTASFSLLIMASYGLDALFQKTSQKGIRTGFIFGFLALTLTFDLYSNHHHLNPLCDWNFYEYHHSALEPVVDDPSLFRVYDDKMPTPKEISNTINNHHIKWQMMLLPNLGILFGLYHVDGIPALELTYQHQIMEILNRPWDEKIRFLELTNVKYIISQERLDQKPALADRITKINGLVYQLNSHLPRAWIVGEIQPEKGGNVHQLVEKSFNPAQTAFGKREIKTSKHTISPGNVTRIYYKKNGRIEIEAHLTDPGILILSESSYPGWKVFVNGREKKLLWLDLLFQGVQLEKGSHQVVFVFRPKYYPLFSGISIAALLILGLLCIFGNPFRARIRGQKAP